MKYVLLFVDNGEFVRDLEAMGPADRERAYQRVVEWMATHAGKIRGGNKLQPPETATTVQLDRGEPVITDGPFVEGQEVVSGVHRDRGRRSRRGPAHGQDLAGCPIVQIRPLKS